LRQTVAHDFPASPAIVGSRDAQRAIARHANLGLDRRNEPGGLRLAWMRRHRETALSAAGATVGATSCPMVRK